MWGYRPPPLRKEYPHWDWRLFGFLSLFTSFGTLIYCALPSLLVLVGLGATVASFLSAAPWRDG